MWDPSSFYIGDNTVQHPIVNGNWKQFLDYMRIVVEEKLIDPDWYTISWNDRKPKLFKGVYGICYYPGVLANETETGTGNTGETIDWWGNMMTPKGAEAGGKIAPGSLFETMRTITASAAKDPVKLERILKIFEDTAMPNDGFWKLRYGVDIDKYEMKDAGDGYKFFNSTGIAGVNYRGYYEGGNLGVWDWGYWIASRSDLVIAGSTDELVGATKRELDLDKECRTFPTFGQEGALLTLDTQITTELAKIQSDFDYKYITGQTDDYEAL